MRHVCTEREIERKKEKEIERKKEKEIEHLFELKPSLWSVYILKTITYNNKQK